MSSLIRSAGLTLLISGLMAPGVAQAQSITADADPTGTVINQTGNQYDITGGTSSGDNLYHSFEQFGLTAGEVANFITNPNTANILGRVTGGNASIIDGLLQVSGSNANLFLLNPSGILLGPNSALNLNGSFTATTASGIGVGDDWFNAVGDNSYAALVGNPNQLAFGGNPAAVVNHGNLTVNTGESVTLVGGSVLNTGTINAPGGDITITAVPGQSLVNLAQDGLVISLDLPTADAIPAADLSGFSPLDLPALLTAGATANATDVTVNGDGTITLSGSSLNIPAEANTAIVAGTIDTASASGIGGVVQVLGEQVALLDGTIDVSGTDGGGEVLVGGEFQGNGTLPNAERTYVGETATILADALNDGDGGRVIIWADDATRFLGTISATGGATSGDGGFVEVSGAQSLDFRGDVDTSAPLGEAGTLLLDPTDITVVAGIALPSPDNVSGDRFWAFAENPGPETIGADSISTLLSTGNLTLQATNSITFGAEVAAFTPGTFKAETTSGNIVLNDNIILVGSVELVAGGSITGGGSVSTQVGVGDSGTIALTAGDSITSTGFIDASNSGTGNAGAITLTAGDSISVTGTSIASEGGTGNAGAVTLTAGGSITLTGILSRAPDGNAGTVTLTAGGSISAAVFSSSAGSGNGGAINLTTTGGSITTTGSITSNSTAGPTGGAINLAAAGGSITTGNIGSAGTIGGAINLAATGGSITTGEIDSESIGSGNGGAINLAATGGSITTSSIDSLGTGGSTGGDITLTAGGDVRIDGDIDASGTTPGNITITHGGNGLIPFTIGDASQNGITGSITSGAFTLDAANPNNPFLASFNEGGSAAGNIDIITDAAGGQASVTQSICPGDCSDPKRGGRDGGGGDGDGGGNSSKVKDANDKITAEFTNHLGISSEETSIADVQDALGKVKDQTGQNPAVVFVIFGQEDGALSVNPDGVPLELLMVTAEGEPIFRSIREANRDQVLTMTQRFRRQVSNINRIGSNSYLGASQQLYDWMIGPIEDLLVEQEITTLAFVTDAGLRSLPFASLHDGEQFLIEKYNMGLLPSLSLVDLTYVDVRQTRPIVAGASQFISQNPLPAAPLEIQAIRELWRGETLQEQDFTIDELVALREQGNYGIVHLTTHGEFTSGALDNSYIQFAGERLPLSRVRELGWDEPALELVTLSACQTALGNTEAELGFAGFAIKAGVKSALASLWKVSDEGTAGLMVEFYQKLQDAPIKAEALRQAQLAMIHGEVWLDGDTLKWSTGELPLPPELVQEGTEVFSHPFFWSAFTLVGSPW